jgi:hypothetical protein
MRRTGAVPSRPSALHVHAPPSYAIAATIGQAGARGKPARVERWPSRPGFVQDACTARAEKAHDASAVNRLKNKNTKIVQQY